MRMASSRAIPGPAIVGFADVFVGAPVKPGPAAPKRPAPGKPAGAAPPPPSGQASKAVGNYGEIFERNVGANSPLKIARGKNALWKDGGLQYAPPVR